MKNAKEWFEEELSGEPLTQSSVIECIEMVQQELIDYVVQRCANEAKLLEQSNWGNYEHFDPSPNFKETEKICNNHFGHGDCTYEIITVSKSSILNVADKIKNELK
jgi:hypothetical protein